MTNDPCMKNICNHLKTLPCRAARCRRWGTVLQQSEAWPLPLLSTVLHVHITTRTRDRLCPWGGPPSPSFSLSLQWLAACQSDWDRGAGRENTKKINSILLNQYPDFQANVKYKLQFKEHFTATSPFHLPGCWRRASEGQQHHLPPLLSALCGSQTAE